MLIQPNQFEPRCPLGQAATPQSVDSTSRNSGGTGGMPGGVPNHRPKLCLFALLLQLRHYAHGDRVHLLLRKCSTSYSWFKFVDYICRQYY